LPERDLALLTEAAAEAGRIALRYWQADPQVWEKPGLGPVTEADLAVNEMLLVRLTGARPGYGWLSEESADDGTRQDAEHLFIVDPIDGTRAFIAGERHFAISLAVAWRGHVTAAVVHLPALALTYTATADGPALCNGLPIHASAHDGQPGARVLASKPAFLPELWETPPAVERHFRASIAYRLALVAAGEFDGMLAFRPSWEWDIAAGHLIAARAGATVTDARGRPITYNSDTARAGGIIAAAPGLHAELMRRLRAPLLLP
jgi:myo-inositol-1(or 4)-monophosphatase